MQYGGGTIQESQDQSRENSKSRQTGFVRTYKQHKSRQAEELDKPFGTERVSFHKSALMSNETTRKANVT